MSKSTLEIDPNLILLKVYGCEGYALYNVLLDDIKQCLGLEMRITDGYVKDLCSLLKISKETFDDILLFLLNTGVFCKEAYEADRVLYVPTLKKRQKRLNQMKTYVSQKRLDVNVSDTEKNVSDTEKNVSDTFANAPVEPIPEGSDSSKDIYIINNNKDKSMNKKTKVKEKDKNIYVPVFEEFWGYYPRKEDKGDAYKQFLARIKEGANADDILDAAFNYAEYIKQKGIDRQYIKLAKTFLSKTKPYETYLDNNINDLSPPPKELPYYYKPFDPTPYT